MRFTKEEAAAPVNDHIRKPFRGRIAQKAGEQPRLWWAGNGETGREGRASKFFVSPFLHKDV